MFCTQCGAKAPETAKFCHKCGAALPVSIVASAHDGLDVQVPIDDDVPERPVSAPAYKAQSVPPLTPAPVYDDNTDEETERPWFMRPLPILAGLALLLSFLVWGTRDFWMGTSPSATPVTNSPTTAAPAPAEDGETAIYYAIRNAKLRDKPTTQGSAVLGELKRGTQIEGTMEMASDGKTQWFKVKGTGQYVAGINLSDVAPPPLTLVLGKTMSLDEQTEIRALPLDSATTLDTVGAGVKVEAIGVTNGWIEIALRKGGVGYIKPSATSANFGISSGQQVAAAAGSGSGADFSALINFDASNCSFGNGMDKIYDAMRANGGKGPFTVVGVPGNLTARYDDPANPEQSTLRLPITGKFRGLTVIEVYQSYQGNGLKFADSVDAVGTAFASSGFTKDDNGGYATSSDGTGGYITNEGGKASLYCGT
jgi:zinc-ribbon domain